LCSCNDSCGDQERELGYLYQEAGARWSIKVTLPSTRHAIAVADNVWAQHSSQACLLTLPKYGTIIHEYGQGGNFYSFRQGDSFRHTELKRCTPQKACNEPDCELQKLFNSTSNAPRLHSLQLQPLQPAGGATGWQHQHICWEVLPAPKVPPSRLTSRSISELGVVAL
jgi:hypothetical protein